ncbi:helix-turn-helix domain-containing protein [Arthrobacter alkaliphilus]|uniref:helix-turn-helix domain-containing protein n=1 Tax=Arthrobacter alkaliphilus TaxID=369936 RepID=UPI003556FDDF
MNKTRSRIVRFLVRRGPATCAQICDELQVSPSAIRRHLHLMREQGLVQNRSHRFTVHPQQVQELLRETALIFEVRVMPCEPPETMDEGRRSFSS